MRIPSSREGSARARRWSPGLVARLTALILLAAPALGADRVPGDWSLPESQPAEIIRQIPYNFRERFTYSLRPDSMLYGTADQFRALYPDSSWDNRAKKMTNENGSLAWATSRDMMALVAMYDATSDPWYLRRLGRLCDAAMAARDDRSGKKDDIGRSLPGWGTGRYSDGKRRVFLVHSALIVQPMLEWAVRANRLPDWTPKEETERTALIDHCKETLLWHDYQLEPNPMPGEMVYASGYEEPERQFDWQPYNRQNLMARDFYLLYQATGDESYKERSRKLYTFFKNRLQVTPSDAYIWAYEPIKKAGRTPVTACDDVSHATYTLEAVLPACRDGFVFDMTDMARFARTFTLYVHWGHGVFQSGIGCAAFYTPRYMERIYAWLPLAQSDPEIYGLLNRFLLHNVEKPVPQAVAMLVALKPKGVSGIDTRAR
jgi:hypothetical protein